MKDFLGLRPVYHWTEQRVRGHIAVCMLAAVIEAVIANQLTAADCGRSGKPAIGDHRKPTWGRCSGRGLVTLAGASVAGVGGRDFEAVVLA